MGGEGGRQSIYSIDHSLQKKSDRDRRPTLGLQPNRWLASKKDQVFASEGIDVITTVDGKCPPTKRATIQSSADKEHACLEALIAKQELALLLQNDCSLQKKIHKLQCLNERSHHSITFFW